MFHHLLVTRFNLRNPEWDVTKNNEKLLTDDWMEERMWFFENFCFPGIVAQTNQDFEWLLYFDVTTPEKYKIRMTELIQNQPNFKVFYIDGMPAFYDELKNYIKAIPNPKPYLITSRIDNDDAVHKDFINEIQLQFNQQEYLVLDIIKGYSLQIRPTVMLGKKEHIFNPFMSLIEKNDDPKTIWFYHHNMWKKETRIKQVTHKRLWIAVIHEKNKVNNFNGYDNVKWDKLKVDFILSEEANELIKNELLPHSKWLKLSWKNKIIVKYKVISKSFKRFFGVYKIK
ncbi:glycosyltransferase [Flavobacterium terrisoli]|uniref:glycosyltransferase n=1 Tax=Flavobacterium terrisoli TaxID=3242195 RepID=UPI002542C9C2|nr:glycosyltransferase [Flavobacterium buctense]